MDTFKENGSYNKTEWEIGDIITTERLNKIEDALYEINENIPTDMSDFNNDAGYLTKQSLEGYATEAYVNDAIDVIKMPDLSDYATTTYVNTAIISLGSNLNSNLNNYATKDYVDGAIAGIEINGGDVNLGNYVTKNELNQNLEDYALKSEIPSINGLVSSNSITRIEIVYEYPANEIQGVLYIKVSE